MSSIGDIIQELGTSMVLASSATWTSAKIQLGQWNSLSVIIYTDQPAVFTTNWSSTSINYDYTDSYNIAASTATQLAIVTVDKWVYFTLQNTGSNETVLRLSCYGTTTNNAVQVTFPSSVSISIAGQPIGVTLTNSVDLSGTVTTVGLKPFPGAQLNFQETFSTNRTTFLAIDPTNGILPSMNWATTNTTQAYYQSNYLNNGLGLSGFDNYTGSGDIGMLSMFYSKSVVPVIPDKPIVISFSAQFPDVVPTSNVYINDERVGFGLPTDYTANYNTFVFGFGVGKGVPVGWNGAYTKFLVWFQNTTYTQNNFNVDVLNGTGPSGITIDTTKFNSFRISYCDNGGLLVLYSILNPTTGKYVIFHTIYTTNSVFSVKNQIGGRFLIQSTLQTATTGLAISGSDVGSFSAYVETTDFNTAFPISTGSSTSVSSSETVMKLFFNNESYQGVRVAIPILIDQITCSTDSTSSCVFTLYKNVTYNAVGTIASINQYYSPLTFALTTTTTSTGVIVGQYTVGQYGTLVTDIKNLILNPGENLLVTGKFAGGSASNANCYLRFNQYI